MTPIVNVASSFRPKKKMPTITQSAVLIMFLYGLVMPASGSVLPRRLGIDAKRNLAQHCRLGACVLVLTSAVPRSVRAESEETNAAVIEFLGEHSAAELSVKEGKLKTAEFVNEVSKERPLCSDEFLISWSSNTETLGLGLEERSYQGFPVTVVRNIKDTTLVEQHPELRVGAIVSAINKEAVDGLPLQKITDLVSQARQGESGEITIKFRDPSRYFELLDSTQGKPLKLVTSSYLPANARDAGAAEQIIYVERLELPPPEQRIRSSQLLDVMEIQYVTQLASAIDSDELKIVDSSAERAPPGTSAQSIYYVLGQQNGPPGFPPPPGWDLTLRGMVVGEKRRITLPYTLAYDRKGDKRRKIPPFATLIFTVKCLSLT